MEINRHVALGLLGVLALVVLSQVAYGVPTGATVTNISTETVSSGNPDNRSDPGGTITTIVLNSVQQNGRWKGYVGNVTGVLTLDDASGFTLYDWSLTNVTITGEVYVVRNASVNFAGVSCASGSTILTEESFLGMTFGTPDSINQTFNYTLHQAFQVGATSILASNCQNTFTFVNDSRQVDADINSTFQEILLEDVSANLIYTTLIEDNSLGYDNGKTFDFQLIVGNHNNVTAVPYYFFTEIATA